MTRIVDTLRQTRASTWAATLLIAGSASLVEGAASRQTDIGVRAIGMGGAYSAVGADASAIRWNPAAIATLQRQEILGTYTDRYGLGLNESYMGYVLPITDAHA
ncbi:MAG: hypothetical protein VYB08_16665, partial [Candidatus Latescibacterota bacterium]|nr:hypothetical protein [Candidatus Latescibacterota bacterium]